MPEGKGFRNTLPICNMCGKVEIINGFTSEIFEGNYYTAVIEATIGNGSTLTVVMETPSTGITVIDGIHVESSGIGAYEFYKDSVSSGGTAITALANDLRTVSVSPTTITKDPTVASAGTRLFGNRVDLKKGGGTTGTPNPWVLKANNKYMAKFTSSAATNYVRIEARHIIY